MPVFYQEVFRKLFIDPILWKKYIGQNASCQDIFGNFLSRHIPRYMMLCCQVLVCRKCLPKTHLFWSICLVEIIYKKCLIKTYSGHLISRLDIHWSTSLSYSKFSSLSTVRKYIGQKVLLARNILVSLICKKSHNTGTSLTIFSLQFW